ncbi:transporter [Vibrio sp. 10N.286.49.B3]|uniref:ComEA family DNA-binding protein n=1 Tax=Vibrio sp. 10N.286.49.B3 TaxID=1880855 RepID=UPI000CC4954E|nr:helix-hairpin-helix domain-containing protein [Vibrio sp. 10N.286.49.B3]PMH41922.1 transporter [Vibrio sp. 10N.286.49.B3]
MDTVANQDVTKTKATSTSMAKKQYEGIDITVNVNTASADELATLLIGVGAKKAQDIVRYREEFGLFKTANDLSNVKGIGAATIRKNEGRILL